VKVPRSPQANGLAEARQDGACDEQATGGAGQDHERGDEQVDPGEAQVSEEAAAFRHVDHLDREGAS